MNDNRQPAAAKDTTKKSLFFIDGIYLHSVAKKLRNGTTGNLSVNKHMIEDLLDFYQKSRV